MEMWDSLFSWVCCQPSHSWCFRQSSSLEKIWEVEAQISSWNLAYIILQWFTYSKQLLMKSLKAEILALWFALYNSLKKDIFIASSVHLAPLHLCHFVIIDVVHLPSYVQLFAAPWTAACQASLSLTISQSLSKFMFIALVMPFSHLILWCPLLLLPLIFPSIGDFSNESSVHISWPKY